MFMNIAAKTGVFGLVKNGKAKGREIHKSRIEACVRHGHRICPFGDCGTDAPWARAADQGVKNRSGHLQISSTVWLDGL